MWGERRKTRSQERWPISMVNLVGCQGVIQQGGPGPWYNQGGPAKVVAHKSFLFTESFLVVKIIVGNKIHELLKI